MLMCVFPALAMGCGPVWTLHTPAPVIVVEDGAGGGEQWSAEERLAIADGMGAWARAGANVAPQFAEDDSGRDVDEVVWVRRNDGKAALEACQGVADRNSLGLTVGTFRLAYGQLRICIDVSHVNDMNHLRAVSAHELGHAWGLGHDERETSVMRAVDGPMFPDAEDVSNLNDLLARAR